MFSRLASQSAACLLLWYHTTPDNSLVLFENHSEKPVDTLLEALKA
jgi:hypothetical protein